MNDPSQRDLSVNPLLQELQALEVELHHPGVNCSPERLERLLHPEFHEVGRSGRPYHRETVVSYLSKVRAQPVVVSDAFAVAVLGAGAALLTYRSAQVEKETGLTKHTFRSSVWLETTVGWQLRYHQGTVAADLW